MMILGIETSCDETATSVGQMVDNRVQILSNVVASSLEIQAKYGGVVPEQAAREQLKSIIQVIEESLQAASYSGQDIDTIAVTQGPGLIGSLLVGVETAKTLALIWNKPLVPVNHLVGHFYANWFGSQVPIFPSLGLLVSGGHTDLILMTGHGKYEYLGGTRDDAAGECFDKCARLLGLPYPGGPAISKLAKEGDPKAFNLPRPMLDSGDFDFSFSGLKTAVANIVNPNTVLRRVTRVNQGGGGWRGGEISGVDRMRATASEDAPEKPKRRDPPKLENLCASIESAIIDVLVKKTMAAAQKYKVEQIMVAGGVAANRRLAERLTHEAKKASLKLFIPSPSLCTDNAAMVVVATFYNYHPADPLTVQANPNLSLSHK